MSYFERRKLCIVIIVVLNWKMEACFACLVARSRQKMVRESSRQNTADSDSFTSDGFTSDNFASDNFASGSMLLEC